MNKSSIILAIVLGCFVAIAIAAPIQESDEVQQSMKSNFKSARERFEGNVNAEKENSAPMPKKQEKKIYSLYTKDLTALGGGKPLLREMNRVHHYVPQAPSVLPREFHIAGDKMTAAEAAKIYVPSPPVQFHEDFQH